MCVCVYTRTVLYNGIRRLLCSGHTVSNQTQTPKNNTRISISFSQTDFFLFLVFLFFVFFFSRTTETTQHPFKNTPTPNKTQPKSPHHASNQPKATTNNHVLIPSLVLNILGPVTSRPSAPHAACRKAPAGRTHVQ